LEPSSGPPPECPDRRRSGNRLNDQVGREAGRASVGGSQPREPFNRPLREMQLATAACCCQSPRSSTQRTAPFAALLDQHPGSNTVPAGPWT
jgi:hypothetical protein